MTLPAQLAADIQSLNPGSIVEMFILDSTVITGGGIQHFHAGTNSLHQPIIWQGVTYPALPVAASGFASSTKDTFARPTLTVSNIGGLMGAIIHALDDLVGATLIRKRTLVKYLDAANFPGGVNPTANPSVAFPDETWVVNRKVSEDNEVIVLELAASVDMDNYVLPCRVIQANLCGSVYRSPECSYAGGPVATKDDVATSDPALDDCSRTPNGCKLRFPNQPLPFGGFVGAGLLQE
jgi:lambda family phage minor tail protein L